MLISWKVKKLHASCFQKGRLLDKKLLSLRIKELYKEPLSLPLYINYFVNLCLESCTIFLTSNLLEFNPIISSFHARSPSTLWDVDFKSEIGATIQDKELNRKSWCCNRWSIFIYHLRSWHLSQDPRNRNCFRQSRHELPLVPDFSNLFHSLSDPFFACLLYFKFTFKGLR